MKNFIITLILFLVAQNVNAQAKFWGGITAGAGKEWYLNNNRNNKSTFDIEHIGLAFKYNINERFALRTGFNYVNKYFDVFELPIGVEYSIFNSKQLDLVISTGIKINKSTISHHDYVSSNCWSRRDTLFGDVSGRVIKNPIHFTLQNGIHGRFLDQFDIGITLNSGFYNFIELRNERFVIQDCSEAKKLEEGFMEHPDKIFRNSYLSLNFTYWVRKQEDEKKQMVKELNLNNKNVLYGEIIGTVNYVTINYDRILVSTARENFNARISIRAGLSVTRRYGSNLITGLNLLYGKDGHYAEVGAGIVHWEHKYANFGYRYQKGELFGKAGLYYILKPNYYENNNKGFFYPGLGIGVIL